MQERRKHAVTTSLTTFLALCRAPGPLKVPGKLKAPNRLRAPSSLTAPSPSTGTQPIHGTQPTAGTVNAGGPTTQGRDANEINNFAHILARSFPGQFRRISPQPAPRQSDQGFAGQQQFLHPASTCTQLPQRSSTPIPHVGQSSGRRPHFSP